MYHYQLKAKSKEGKNWLQNANCSFDPCCLSAWKHTLVLETYPFITAINIWEFKISQTFCMYHYQLNAKNKEKKINCKTLIANFRFVLLVCEKRYISANNASIYCCNQYLKLLFWILCIHWKQNLQPLNNKTALWWWFLWNQPFVSHLDILMAKNMQMAKLVLIKLLLLCKLLNDILQNLCSTLAGKANLTRCSNRL